MEFRRFSAMAKWVFLVLGVILLLLGVGAVGENAYAAGVYMLIGMAQAIIAGTGMIRTRGVKDSKEFGDKTVQHSWWILSVGLASLALVTSPFLSAPLLLELPAGAVSLVWIVLGAVTIYIAVERAGAEIVV